MDRAYLLQVARRASGLTQAELAARSGTSQATMSAYERGLKSPTLKVAARILEAAGYDLNLRRLIDWVEHEAPGVGHFWVPSTLWHVETPDCFAILAFPDLVGDGPMREWDMHDRAQRKGVYEQLLQGGSPEEMIRWIDGPLLVDVWEELELPDAVREAWKWPIVIARGPTHPDTVRILGRGDDSFTAEAWVRGHEAVPRRAPAPKEPRVRVHPDALRPAAARADGGRRRDEGGSDRRQGRRKARHSIGNIAAPLRPGHLERWSRVRAEVGGLGQRPHRCACTERTRMRRRRHDRAL